MIFRRGSLLLLRLLRVRAQRLGPGVAILARRGRAVRLIKVDRGTWLAESDTTRPRQVRRVGPPRLRTHLLTDRRAVRADVHAYQRGLYEHMAIDHVVWMLNELRVNCVLDVGANVGQYARKLRRHGYRGRIVSFEPVPALAARLSEAASDDPRWQVRECALADVDGTAEINVRPGSMSSLLPSSEFGEHWSPRLREREAQTIRTARLDGIFDDLVSDLSEPRVYLKLDTQGYDLQAFTGAGDALSHVVGMQSEVACVPIYRDMPRLPEQIAAYEARGFEITGMFPVTRDPATRRIIEFDVVMVRPEAVRTPQAR